MFDAVSPNKIRQLIKDFDDCEISSNRAFIKGSLDFCSLLLEKEDLNIAPKLKLHGEIGMYIDEIFKLRVLISNNLNILTDLKLTTLKYSFDKIQDLGVSLKIMPRLDDDNLDLELLLKK